MLTPDQEGVAILMSCISEEHYCAGWLRGLEFSLWDYVSGTCPPGVDFGFGVPNPGLIKMLKFGSDMIGGWIVWDDNAKDGYTFVSIEEWERLYAEHRRELIAKRSVPLEEQGKVGDWRSAT